MTTIRAGYVCRDSPYHRNWWMIKYTGSGVSSGIVDIHGIRFPIHMVGKRIRLKLEIIDDEVIK